VRPRIERNRIHDCGKPATLSGHGIYMQNVDDAEIVGNTIYDNADRGIKVGPDSKGR
jgi:parallel beta-helix repeat protein